MLNYPAFPTLRLKNGLFLKNKRKMEEEKYMMVAEDFIKEPPAVPCCQKKNNGLSELDFSPRNSTVAKPECIIHSPLVSLKGKNIVSRIFPL